MSEIPAPTPDDFKRDLAADLAIIRQGVISTDGWSVQVVAKAAIRRCDLAEGVARARKELLDTAYARIAELETENARLRHNVANTYIRPAFPATED